MSESYAAIDLGAESGRVVRGAFDGRRVALEVVHRFANRPMTLPDGLHWNLPSLFAEALDGVNTVFGLLADERPPALAAAERIALVPDLMALWLTGEATNEATAVSTTGLLDARSGTWAPELIARLGLPPRPFSGEPVEPGTRIGVHGDVPVFAVAGHDTASAFVATPLATPDVAILSSGTWSPLGVELERLQEAAGCHERFLTVTGQNVKEAVS